MLTYSQIKVDDEGVFRLTVLIEPIRLRGYVGGVNVKDMNMLRRFVTWIFPDQVFLRATWLLVHSRAQYVTYERGTAEGTRATRRCPSFPSDCRWRGQFHVTNCECDDLLQEITR